MRFYYHFIDIATEKPCMVSACSVLEAKQKIAKYKGITSEIETRLRFVEKGVKVHK